MLHFTFQNMRAFYGPWPRGLGLNEDTTPMTYKHTPHIIINLSIVLLISIY